MTGGVGQRSITARDLLLAALAATAILALTLAGTQRSRLLTLERRAAEDEATVGEVAAGVAVDLEHGLAAVGEVARNAAAPQVAAQVPAVPGASTIGYDLRDPLAPGPRAVLSAAARTEPEVAAVLDRARDSGEVVLGGPVDLGDGPRLLIVAAAYAREAQVGRPQTAVDRRTRLEGWVVAPVDPDELMRAQLPPDTAARLRDGGLVLATTDTEAPGDLAEQTIEVQGHQLTMGAGARVPVGVIAPTLTIAVGGVILAAVAAAGVLVMAARLRAHRLEATERGRQVQLIGEVAPLVQQSLELAEVLPAVAVQLSDHFGLAGVSVSTGTSSAGQVELFSIGDPPAPAAKVALRPPARVAAGETLALALQRGGRSVALLHLVAGRDLDEVDLQSLRALTELVTAAVVNASLYASQQEALHRLRELDALKTVFLGTASHELRTPATAISGFSSLLTSSWDRFDEVQRRDFVERIGANARSLSAVVQDLLDFSLLDKGTVSVAIEPVDLGRLVASVVERLAPMFMDHELAFSAAAAPDVAGDVNGLERIVTNLLANAVKFSPAGTTVTVAVGPAEDGYGAQVVVTDQGPGIPEDERPQVFTRFYRGAGDAVVQTRGVGIGLSVVAELVARLRGEVHVGDGPDGGACFTVRLPRSTPLLLAKEVEHAPTT